MSIPTIPRLILFTLAVLAGAAAILTDRFSVLGILLVGFSSTILMNKGEQSKHWATPLTEVANTSRIPSNDCYSIVPRVPDRDLRAEFVKIQGSGQLDVRRFQIRFCCWNCVHDWPTLVAMV